jgi:hypothetical protein
MIALSMLAAIGAAVPQGGGALSAELGPTPTPSPTVDNLEAVKEFLISSAASDFHKHQVPLPVRFRKVRFGHIGDTTKSGSYRICGQFSASEKGNNKSDWTDFATIKTSGYEQYIGKTTYCTDSKIIWDKTVDLSPILKNRLDSLKKEK